MSEIKKLKESYLSLMKKYHDAIYEQFSDLTRLEIILDYLSLVEMAIIHPTFGIHEYEVEIDHNGVLRSEGSELVFSILFVKSSDEVGDVMNSDSFHLGIGENVLDKSNKELLEEIAVYKGKKIAEVIRLKKVSKEKRHNEYLRLKKEFGE